MIYTDREYVQNTLVKRKPSAHKGDFGRMLVFAGSPGMAGAGTLCAKAALKSGAGLVRFLLPSLNDPVYPIFQIGVPEATCISAQNKINFNEYTSIAAGSGLGREKERMFLLSAIIENYSGVLILDADALNIISENSCMAELVKKSGARIIITPHVGEAKRLLNPACPKDVIIASDEQRFFAAQELSQKYNCICALKGAGTIVCESKIESTEFFINTTGNPGMATAGSGDALSGVIASLAGQGYSPLDAARLGVYIHGLAGDLAAEDKGQMGLTAADIADNIPYALKQSF